MYDDTALSRLQSILLFRELEFPLKEIKAILDSPDFDASEAISQQIELLELKCKHIEELITFAREIQNKGITTMNFEVFGKSEIEKYKAEIKAKWGNTKEYQDYRQKDIAETEVVLVQHCANNGEYSTCLLRQRRVVVSQRWNHIASFLRLALTQKSGTVFTVICATLY